MVYWYRVVEDFFKLKPSRSIKCNYHGYNHYRDAVNVVDSNSVRY